MALLALIGPMASAKGETAQQRYDRLMIEHPAPKLSAMTRKTVVARWNHSRKELTGKLSIQVEAGTIKWVRVKESTGFKHADDAKS